jgi:MiaB-like tRNA modifying enzyme
MRVYVKTFGCSSNKADSAAIEELLRKRGMEPASGPDDADAVVVNTCTVRKETELEVLRFLEGMSGRRTVVTGCMAEVQPALVAKRFPLFSIVSPHNLQSLPQALDSACGMMLLEHNDLLPDPARYRSGAKYTLSISRGCLGDCTYCIARLARGKLHSLPPELIIDLTSEAVLRGACEIRLSSQDACAYGMDISTDLPALLHRIAGISGDFRVRVGMFNPSLACAMPERLVESYRPAKVYKFAHIPVQSGSDSILSSMNRRYTAESFRRLICEFRSNFPQMTFFTDVIAGYPGETDDDFTDTLDLIREIRPDKTHIARFSPRPHTSASSLRQVPEAIKKRRSEQLTQLAAEIQEERNGRWVGKVLEANVVDTYHHGGMLARTDEYKAIALDGCPHGLLGRRVLVSVDSCTPFYLKGSVTCR